MILRSLFLFLLIGITYSCTAPEESIADNLPLGTEAIADKIAESKIYQETTLALKDQHMMLLSGIMEGENPLTSEEVSEFEKSTDRKSYLASKNFNNSQELATTYSDLEVLTVKLQSEFDKIKVKVGDEKFAQIIEVLDTKYSHTTKVSAEEALSLIK
jgi:hypothetical protein